MESLSSFLPIRFENSDFLMHELSLRCPKCREVIPEENTVGTVVRLIESVAAVNGEASCPCGHVESFSFRVRSDGVLDVPTEEGWQQIDVAQETECGLGSRLSGFVRKAAGFFGLTHGN